MRNARPQQAEASANGQRNSTAGALPARTNTVRAEVLAELIDGKRLTGIDSVFAQNTTRLAAVIHALEKDYLWRIARRDIEKGTVDGRTVLVTEYWLSEDVCATAFADGARAWVNEVLTKRAEQRGQRVNPRQT